MTRTLAALYRSTAGSAMQCLIRVPLFLLLPQLVFAHATLSEPRPLRKRAAKENIGIIAGVKGRSEGSDFFCDARQTVIIEKAILWMHYYAAYGFNFLRDDDAGTTAAFIGWFGYSNEKKADDMRKYIYDAIYKLGSEAKYYVSALEDIDETVVIGCATETNYSPCNATTLAVAHSEYSTIVVCPAAFSNGDQHVTEEAEFASQRTWRDSRLLVLTGGQSLLHEMTHLKGVVGDFRHWKGAASTDHAYKPSDCIKLADNDMLNNAQNYLLFALEVGANAHYAKKQVNLDVKNKWNEAVDWLRAGVGGRREEP